MLLGAPLGNPGDASTRLREELASADIIAAEDTRRLHRLVHDLGVSVRGRVLSYFEGNEVSRTGELIAAAVGGARVALVTDGGMPSVSDPGFRLVRAAVQAGVEVTAAPGPSAVTTALALSGLPCDRFVFEGFLPRQAAARRKLLVLLAGEERTIVIFEAARRVATTLAEATVTIGPDRPAALCRELTKTYEEVIRATLGELTEWAAGRQVRGEVTLVIAGVPPHVGARGAGGAGSFGEAELGEMVADLVGRGLSQRDAVDAIAQRLGRPRREIYHAALRHRDKP